MRCCDILKMKFPVPIITIVCVGIFFKACYSFHHVVTRFYGVEEYFLQSVRDIPDIGSIRVIKSIRPPKRISEICQHVTQTPYFQMRLESPLVKTDKRTRWEIRKEHPEVYKYYYTPPFWYKQMPVFAGGKRIMRHLWPCFVRSQRTQRIVPYYLTAGKRYQPFFLLGYDNNENLIVHALVEEPAMSILHEYGSSLVNYLFGVAVQKKTNDVVCKLDENQMLRLCHAVLLSSAYSEYLKFWPTRYNVVPTCVERSVLFKLPTDNDIKMYKMRTMACTGRGRKSQKRKSIYISETDKPKYPAVFYVKINIDNVDALLVDDIVFNLAVMEEKLKLIRSF